MAQDEESRTAPVYVPWATFISALDALRQHGIPASGKIDKSIWDSQSGTIQSQLILGFKFLGLIDEQKRVSPQLPPLVSASPEERKPILKKLIEEKYQSVIAQDLMTISPAQFDEAFRKFGVSGSTLDRATRFFVKACTQLDIPIAKRFLERSKSTTSTPRKRRANAGARHSEDGSSESGENRNNEGRTAGSWEQQLLSKFPSFDPQWPDELKAKWFEGFERLMKGPGS